MFFMKIVIMCLSVIMAVFSAESADVNIVVEPYIQNPSKTAITIMWICRKQASYTVAYGKGTKLDKQIVVSAPKHTIDTIPLEYVYEIRLSGLKPGSTYNYEVRFTEGAKSSTFKTFPDDPGKWRFINYGDSRHDPRVHRQIASCFDAHNAAFILSSGDLVGSGGYGEWVPQYFAPLTGVINHIPIYPARGNHEGDGVVYQQVHALPGNERWYSFDYRDHCLLI